ncbi:hypothetical protein QH494_25655, partial [Sphingomonas sp. AR_OL41]|uniref:hypothetical protein n=1 Tax=Sphingomonas sp. AR_OL41 TaxID=3042729 RepID=UPI0024815DAE
MLASVLRSVRRPSSVGTSTGGRAVDVAAGVASGTGVASIGVAQSMVLAADDMCFPTYRVQGWLIARG